jgi:hypothetical protein
MRTDFRSSFLRCQLSQPAEHTWGLRFSHPHHGRLDLLFARHPLFLAASGSFPAGCYPVPPRPALGSPAVPPHSPASECGRPSVTLAELPAHGDLAGGLSLCPSSVVPSPFVPGSILNAMFTCPSETGPRNDAFSSSHISNRPSNTGRFFEDPTYPTDPDFRRFPSQRRGIRHPFAIPRTLCSRDSLACLPRGPNTPFLEWLPGIPGGRDSTGRPSVIPVRIVWWSCEGGGRREAGGGGRNV